MAKRVLLVDDEPHILHAAEFKLKRGGHDVVCAYDGQEAWEEIQREIPDLLITDFQMPRLDGLGLLTRVRENLATRHLPAFLLTAKGFELSAAEIRDKYGVLDVIAKPFSPRDVLQRVTAVLEGLAPTGRA